MLTHLVPYGAKLVIGGHVTIILQQCSLNGSRSFARIDLRKRLHKHEDVEIKCPIRTCIRRKLRHSTTGGLRRFIVLESAASEMAIEEQLQGIDAWQKSTIGDRPPKDPRSQATFAGPEAESAL